MRWLIVCVCVCELNPHTVKPRHHVSSIFTLDDGLLILSIPVLKLVCELDGDDLHVAWVMVPGEVTVHTDYIYIGSLAIGKDEDWWRCALQQVQQVHSNKQPHPEARSL